MKRKSRPCTSMGEIPWAFKGHEVRTNQKGTWSEHVSNRKGGKKIRSPRKAGTNCGVLERRMDFFPKYNGQ